MLLSLKRIYNSRRLKMRFPTAVIYAGAVVDQVSNIDRYVVLFPKAAIIDSEIGAFTYVQSESMICSAEIGKFCSIASRVTIGLGQHPTNMVSTSPVFYDNTQPLPRFFTDLRRYGNLYPRTVVGADVWIGQGVMIKAGVTIGAGAVIGAGSIVTKDVKPYTISAGDPCRFIRMRFDESLAEKLIRSKWWEYDDNKLRELCPFMEDPEVFIKKIESSK